MSDNIELHSLGQGTALSNGHNISLLNSEGWCAVGVDVLVTLLETTVLLDVVKVVATDDDGALHLGGDDEPLEDLATDGNVTGEGALLVDVVALDRGVGGLDTQADILDPAHRFHLPGVGALAGDEDGILALVSLLVLYRVPPPHDNGAQVVLYCRAQSETSISGDLRAPFLTPHKKGPTQTTYDRTPCIPSRYEPY